MFQLPHVEVPAGRGVVGPAQENVARCLQDALTIGYPLSGMPVEFGAETRVDCCRMLRRGLMRHFTKTIAVAEFDKFCGEDGWHVAH